MEIRGVTISFSSYIQKQKDQEEQIYKKEIKHLEERQPTGINISEINHTN